MEFIQNLIVTILLGIWAVGSVALVLCLIQNIIMTATRKSAKWQEPSVMRNITRSA